MHTYILVDASNLFYRQIKMVNPSLGVDSMIGMALHLILYSMRKEFITWKGTHVVFFLEGRSWRYDIYPEYKAQRKVDFAKQSITEQENHKLFVEAFNDFTEYLDTKTNISVIRNPNAEADDMIATWVEAHSNDQHILISSDSDFFQLLRHSNVVIYDPVKDILIKQDGIFDDKNKRLQFTIDSGSAKIKVGKLDDAFACDKDWYEFALFLKCVRGDTTDNIFSSYPGVRINGTKNSVGIKEAYNDKDNMGYNWTNFMLQRWLDHNKKEQRVKEQYEFNRKLIDLREIPENVKLECLKVIATETERKNVVASEIGHSFLRFCGKWGLKRISDNAESFMVMMRSKYKE